MARIARTLYEAMANNLNLDTKQSYLSESTGFIRVQRYPPISKGSQGWEVGDHKDSFMLTILNQNQLSGIQVLKDDEWFSVKPVSDELVVSLGHMMQAMSGDEYVSAKNRVKVNRQEDRIISICYSVFPEHESLIQSSNYKPFTYNDYCAQSQRYMETMGFKVGLQRFKIIGN
ncbi:hypothetical protein SLEP1_g6983 [Rubroshorea leprosula]|uniref:Isopenicillin N synthase-like Fe(2+) 2OG dioxygenase domain-containing protein n=1 Tax=Rubroshorea leprosula TaxID=152421 RepID=A0AAV5I5Y6_9ROSI|nr:hypothetical protein SLEP1_g6983 [Rubroshorea leprosula]